MSVYLLIDVIFAPTRVRLPWRTLWFILAFPLAWAAYTLVRGPLVTNPSTLQPYWYPYPFLDPNGSGGWGSVALYVLGISVLVVAVGVGVVAWRRQVSRNES